MTDDICKLIQTKNVFVFDLDGTIIDSVEAHVSSWINAVKVVMGVELDPDSLRTMIGLGGRKIIAELLGEKGVREYAKIRWFKDRFFLNCLRNGQVQLFPGAFKLLKLLKVLGFKIGLATSTPIYMALHILDFFDISQYFVAITCGDEVKRGKPAPDIFASSISRLESSPSETIIVGDTTYDAIPALLLGAVPVLVNSNETRMNDESSQKGILIFESIESLYSKIIDCFGAKNLP